MRLELLLTCSKMDCLQLLQGSRMDSTCYLAEQAKQTVEGLQVLGMIQHSFEISMDLTLLSTDSKQKN